MTFIASVIAKKGVAIIADSLVTSQLPILHYDNFIDYLNNHPKNPAGETVINDPNEILRLFNHEPIFTKDYEEKLFQFNNYTALTTAGTAYLNDKSISDIIEEFKGIQGDEMNDMAIDISIKIDALSAFLNDQVKEHLGKYRFVEYCLFVITYYEKHTHKTHIFKLVINPADRTALANAGHIFVTLQPKEADFIRVVCDGQNKISDLILFGFGKPLYWKMPTIVQKIAGKLGVDAAAIPATFVDDLVAEPDFNNMLFGDIELFNLTDLSVQQAVDLASLLMRIEVDFQKYTKNIPTVGGVIKLAVIDEKGFRFILGDTIIAPKHINL